MKKSDFVNKFQEDWGASAAEDAAKAAEAAGVTWDPEEPEGFLEWYQGWCEPPGWSTISDTALAAWNACLSRQEAQQRAIEPKVDPEVRRKEIEAQIEAWAEKTTKDTRAILARQELAVLGSSLLHHLGVL